MGVVMHLCICPCVCKCLINIWCLYETPIYFSYIYCYIVMALWESFPGECILVWQSLVKKFVVVRGFTKMVLLFILVVLNIWIVFHG